MALEAAVANFAESVQKYSAYKDLKAYGLQPDDTRSEELAARFDTVFRQKTGYASLDLALRRLRWTP